MRKSLFCIVLVSIFVATICADIPRPSPQPKPPAAKSMPGKMYIDLRSDAKVPTLKIRREVLDSLRASLDQGAESDTAATTGIALGRLNTIVAGALLSVALIFAGFIAFRGSVR